MILETRNTRNTERFSDNKIGICHIIPAFLIRKKVDKAETFQSHKIDSIQYTVPSKSVIKISLTRRADARLYGTSYGSRGVAVNPNNQIIISQSTKIARIIQLGMVKK